MFKEYDCEIKIVDIVKCCNFLGDPVIDIFYSFKGSKKVRSMEISTANIAFVYADSLHVGDVVKAIRVGEGKYAGCKLLAA